MTQAGPMRLVAGWGSWRGRFGIADGWLGYNDRRNWGKFLGSIVCNVYNTHINGDDIIFSILVRVGEEGDALLMRVGIRI